MKRRGLTSAAAALLLLTAAAGCRALPAGDPPAGGITDNGERRAETFAALRSRLATRLAASALAAPAPWRLLKLECDPELLELAAAAAGEAAPVAGFAVLRGEEGEAGAPAAIFRGRRSETGWEFTLLSPRGETLWSDLSSPVAASESR